MTKNTKKVEPTEVPLVEHEHGEYDASSNPDVETLVPDFDAEETEEVV